MRVLMVVCVLLLSACGIKGPLFLPPADPGHAETPPAEASPSPAEPSPTNNSPE